MLLNNQEIIEEIKEEIRKYLETNDNENTTIQNLWDAAKAVLRGKFKFKSLIVRCTKQHKVRLGTEILKIRQRIATWHNIT